MLPCDPLLAVGQFWIGCEGELVLGVVVAGQVGEDGYRRCQTSRVIIRALDNRMVIRVTPR